ncbi:bifunctional folylpolyglutamate synthase/dihydrofolate synthase, partial [Tritonibacter sp. SIMBA_163]
RICLAGDLISEADLTQVLDERSGANGAETVNYHYMTAVAGLMAFSRSSAEHALVEGRLGGPLGAANVIPPEVSVITPIAIDHEQ